MNVHRGMKQILTRQNIADAFAFDRGRFPLRSYGEVLGRLVTFLITSLFRGRRQFRVTSPGAFLRKRAV